MEHRLTSNYPVGTVLLLILLLSGETFSEKSLFDDLPLNGAFSPALSGVNIKHVKSSQKPLEIKLAVRNSKEVVQDKSDKVSISTQSATPPTFEGEFKSHENSLFNELPDHGAMYAEDTNSNEQQMKTLQISSTQKRSFDNSNSGGTGGGTFGGAVRNYFTSFFDSGKIHTSSSSATPTPVTFQVLHSQPGVSPIITSSHGVRVPLIVTNRENQTNVFDANVSPQHQQFAIPVLNQHFTTRAKGDPASVAIPVRHFTPENRYRTYDESHHYFPSKTKVQSYPTPSHHYVHSKPAEIVYGTSRYDPQQLTGGYTYRPPTTTTSTTTTPEPVVTQPPYRPTRPPPMSHLPIPIVSGNPANTNPAQDTFADYDYDTLQERPNIFGSRTGSFSVSVDGGIGLSHSRSTGRYNNDPSNQQHHAQSYSTSTSTGWNEPEHLKPVHIPPPASYGPPVNYEPSPSYGPPAPPPEIHPPAPPPPPPPPPAAPPATATTSISYQTIPIQTVQTQLITVPHITVSSSSTVDNEVSQDTPVQRPQSPQRPPSSGYGPPPSTYDAAQQTIGNTQVSKKSGSLFTDDQIAALLAFNHGLGGGDVSSGGVYASRETDALSLLAAAQAQQQTGRGVGLQGLAGQLGLGLGTFDDSLQGLGLSNGDSLQLQPPLQNLVRSRPPSLFRQRPLVPATHPLRLNSLNTLRNNNNGLYKRNVAELLARQRYADNFGTLPNQGLLLDSNRYGTGAGGTILTKDAIQAVNDLVQEQRLRGAVNDLRTRLDYEGRSAARARENYRSLFYKGALLLSALTLIPTLASPIASATVAQNALNAASPLGHLLPLAAGRRRRDADQSANANANGFEDCTPILLRNSSFNNWLNCAENATAKLFQNTTNLEQDNSTESLFDSLAFNGALVPENIRANLIKYLPAEEIKRNSECIQRRFCETLKQIETLPNAESILFIYSIFAGDINNNPWIREAMTGGYNNNCGAFYCWEDYQHSD